MNDTALPPVRLHRAGQGSTLLLLHCLGVDRNMWSLAAAGLDAHFTLITCDFPGHGEAAPAAGAYDIAALSRQIAAGLDALGTGAVHVGGISLGGLVAQHLAATRPELVDRLILIDTTPRYTDEMRANWAERAAIARSSGVGGMSGALLSIWFTAEAIAANGPAVRYVRECFANADGQAYARACEALAGADLRPLAARIAAPTLVVCGEQDIPSFIDAARWLAGAIAGAQPCWLAPARHASVLEQPDAFVAAARRFLG